MTEQVRPEKGIEQKCSNCRFYERANSLEGQCRKYAPRSYQYGQQNDRIIECSLRIIEHFWPEPKLCEKIEEIEQRELQSVPIWPLVDDEEWCGEWRPHARLQPVQGDNRRTFFVDPSEAEAA